jgi:hypothetical protein
MNFEVGSMKFQVAKMVAEIAGSFIGSVIRGFIS